jgi:hypothetical protein
MFEKMDVDSLDRVVIIRMEANNRYSRVKIIRI